MFVFSSATPTAKPFSPLQEKHSILDSTFLSTGKLTGALLPEALCGFSLLSNKALSHAFWSFIFSYDSPYLDPIHRNPNLWNWSQSQINQNRCFLTPTVHTARKFTLTDNSWVFLIIIEIPKKICLTTHLSYFPLDKTDIYPGKVYHEEILVQEGLIKPLLHLHIREDEKA